MDSVVSLRQAIVLLGGFPALAGADLDVRSGEAVLLQGPNGAGKTTILRLCAGLARLESGTAEVLGVDLATDRVAVRPHVAYAGHRSMLYDELTVAENIDFWGAASAVNDDERWAAADRLAVDERLHDVEVRRLSAGQRRRVSLAVAAARRPSLWLLDEPHAGLDQAGRDVVDQLIADATDAGASVLIASHELDRVRRSAGRTVTVAGGRVLEAVARG